MDLIGIENEAEFFPSGTLSDVLKDELQDITSRWAGLEKGSNPVERLARAAAPTIEMLRQIRNTSDEKRQMELIRDSHHKLLSALGYDWKRETALTALIGSPIIPLVGRVALDLSRFCAAPSARLRHLPFEGDRAFPTQC